MLEDVLCSDGCRNTGALEQNIRLILITEKAEIRYKYIRVQLEHRAALWGKFLTPEKSYILFNVSTKFREILIFCKAQIEHWY